uniref:Ribosome binding factor A n=1 Tax=Crocodylus porosus TaxID=8502 RepID=A0A7M4E9V7_CROPO
DLLLGFFFFYIFYELEYIFLAASHALPAGQGAWGETRHPDPRHAKPSRALRQRRGGGAEPGRARRARRGRCAGSQPRSAEGQARRHVAPGCWGAPGSARLRRPGRLQEPAQEIPPQNQVSLVSDFSVCRVYWNSTAVGNIKHVESILQKSALRIRYLLLARQVLRNMPPIVFVKDKEAEAMRKIDELLAVADFGPEKENSSQNDFSESETSVTTLSSDMSASSLQSNLFGVDHKVLNKQIMEYKKMKKMKNVEGIGWAEQQHKQLAEVQKHMRMKKKTTMDSFQNYVPPQEYLLNNYNTEYLDDETPEQTAC